jgi:uncharacterized protein (TIGR03790 family)
MTQINTDYRTCPGSRPLILLFVACLMLAVGATRAQRPGPVSVRTVVMVKNLNNADSVAIADYYQCKRKLPAENVCAVRCTDVEECSYKEYEEQLKRPSQQFLAHLNRPIDYIVLTKGIPIRTHEGNTGGFSVDSLLVMMDKAEPAGFPGGVEPMMVGNPYFTKAVSSRHTQTWGKCSCRLLIAPAVLTT